MSKFSYLVREFLRTLYRHPGATLGSYLSLTLLFLLFDLFWIAARTSNEFYASLVSDLHVEAFVTDAMPDSSLSRLSTSVTDLRGVRSVEYISREQARHELASLMGTDLLTGFDSLNPLPRSFVLSIEPEYRRLGAIQEIERQLQSLEGIAEVFFSERWLQQIETTRRLIRNMGMGLGVIILLTALISSANSIRLMTRARAVGLHQMILLGSGRFFAALPFMLEGFVLGGLSALTGWVFVLYAYKHSEFTQFEIVLPTVADMTLFCGVTALLGGISGYFGIRKLLT